MTHPRHRNATQMTQRAQPTSTPWGEWEMSEETDAARDRRLERETLEDYLADVNERIDRDYDAMSPDEQRLNTEGVR